MKGLDIKEFTILPQGASELSSHWLAQRDCPKTPGKATFFKALVQPARSGARALLPRSGPEASAR
jgi:hypothetical protein